MKSDALWFPAFRPQTFDRDLFQWLNLKGTVTDRNSKRLAEEIAEQHTMDCEERDKLQNSLEAARVAHNQAISDLEHFRGSTAKPDYTRLFVIAEDARLHMDLARAILLNHMAWHSCSNLAAGGETSGRNRL